MSSIFRTHLALAAVLAVAVVNAGCGGDGPSTAPDAGLDAGHSDSGPECGALDLCGGECTDTERDRENCGACGNACDDGEVCSAGACTLSCMTGLDDCSGSCRDLQTDRAHCGACGNACDDGEVCSAGACTLSCMTGLDDCSGSCRDLQIDRAHCGACGNACAAGQLCVAGTCAATCGSVDCSAYDRACVRSVCVVVGGRARCQPQNVPDGTSCDASTGGCTSGAMCLGGLCGADALAGVPPVCTQSGILLRRSGVTAVRGFADPLGLDEDACPAGSALTGFRGVHSGTTPGTWIKRIQGVCSRIVVEGTTVTLAAGVVLTPRGVDPSGTPWTSLCPLNQVVVGFGGRAGSSALEAIGVRCAPITIGMGSTTTITRGAVTAQPLVGGSGGSAFPATDCPAGEIATAQRIYTSPGSNPTHGLALRCSDLELITGS